MTRGLATTLGHLRSGWDHGLDPVLAAANRRLPVMPVWSPERHGLPVWCRNGYHPFRCRSGAVAHFHNPNCTASPSRTKARVVSPFPSLVFVLGFLFPCSDCLVRGKELRVAAP